MSDDQPANPPPRIATLDILRGIAILGILFMNISVMGAPIAAAHSPLPSLIGWTPLDRAAWAFREVLMSGTARCLLQMLFGAGMLILTDRMATRSARWHAIGRYYWRTVVLFLFGLAHVWLLLWPGDVLHIYAGAALLALPLRRLSARWLIPLGLSFAVYASIMSGMALTNAIHDNAVVAAARAHQAAGIAPTADERKAIKGLDEWHDEQKAARTKTAQELIARGSGFRGWAAAMIGEWTSRYHRWRSVLGMYWEALATILLGAALFKLGILQGTRTRHFYVRLALAGYAIGLPIRLTGIWFAARMDDTVTYAWALSEVARLAMTIGHLGLLCWLLGESGGGRLLQPFVAAGRTALSLYILQTLICVWLLYPPFALGLFGKQGWMALMLTALAIDVALLVLANWWVRRWPIAPVEWAWRSLAAGRRLAFGRAGSVPRGPEKSGKA